MATNDKRNSPRKIHFKKMKLSEDAKDAICKTLGGPSKDKLSYAVWRIEGLYDFFKLSELNADVDVRPKMKQGKRTFTGSVQSRIQQLLDALEGLDKYTKKVLSDGYAQEYPHPKVSEQDKTNCATMTRALLENQDSKTSIWVPRKPSDSGWTEAVAEPLPFRELLTRVEKACKESKDHVPRRAGLIMGTEKVFISQLIKVFEDCTGGKASTTPDAPFDKFIRAVYGNLDPSYPADADQTTIIKKAIAFNRAGLRLQNKVQAEP